MTKELIKTFQYRITQATASQLVVILYDIADRYLEDACESDEEVQIRDNIYMSGKVIDQLISGLDMQYEVSANLFVGSMIAGPLGGWCIKHFDRKGGI